MVETAVTRANSNNVLSAVVTAVVRDADSVAVRFQGIDEAGAELETPSVPATNGAVVLPVLGLLPVHRYAFRVVGRTARATALSETMTFTTDTLPADLPQYVASGSTPTPGFVVFAAGRYGIVIDNSGRVVWYRRFPNGPGLTFTAQPSGHYYARPPGILPSDPAPWVELDALGNATRTVGCADGLVPRFHDLIATGDDTFWLLCDDTRETDLTALGGAAKARVTATDVERVTGDGRLLFRWSPFDHFDLADAGARELAKADVNWTHGNSLDLTPDGNLLVSLRNLGEYGSLPAVITVIGGSVQDLPNGHTLVSFGTAGRLEEYDASGRAVWRIERGADYVFHAQRIRSLYVPGVGLTR